MGFVAAFGRLVGLVLVCFFKQAGTLESPFLFLAKCRDGQASCYILNKQLSPIKHIQFVLHLYPYDRVS